MHVRFAVAIAVFFAIAAAPAFSQGPLLSGGKMQTSVANGTFGGSYYNFAGDSGCDFLISVWGHVNNPGRYNVPCETNLLDLLSFCGGPRKGAILDRIKIIRRGGVDDQNTIARVYEIDVEQYLELTEESAPATELFLFPRDLIIIEGADASPVDIVLRVSQVIVAITSLITATVAIVNISKD